MKNYGGNEIHLLQQHNSIVSLEWPQPQEVAQSAETTPNEADVISLNLPLPFCADI